MIKDLFLYFARFPRKEGVTSMFTMGTSPAFSEYQDLLRELTQMTTHSLVPDIDHYVYGQSFDDLQQRLSRLFGSWLYADYGELQMQTEQGSLSVSQRVAVTVAVKLNQTSDMVERMIASDRALSMLSEVQAHIMADCDSGQVSWIARGDLGRMELIPFVATELNSYGWTLLLNVSAPDLLGTHHRARHLNPFDL